MLNNSGVTGNFDLKVLNPVTEKIVLSLSKKMLLNFGTPQRANPRGNIVCLKYPYILKNILPDFFYIDGPDPNNIKDFKSSQGDSLIPCVIDILYLEEKLKIGTLVLIDGRDFNENILWSNFKRN